MKVCSLSGLIKDVISVSKDISYLSFQLWVIESTRKCGYNSLIIQYPSFKLKEIFFAFQFSLYAIVVLWNSNVYVLFVIWCKNWVAKMSCWTHLVFKRRILALLKIIWINSPSKELWTPQNTQSLVILILHCCFCQNKPGFWRNGILLWQNEE